MTSWLVLLALAALFTLAVRYARVPDPPLPDGYDGERQRAELAALVLNARIH